MGDPRPPWITEPGVYAEVTPEDYLRDPVVGGSVTSSVLRMMTPPEFTPAHARHYLDHGREPKGYYDVGSAYHTRVLGRGGKIITVDAYDWKTKAAREVRDAAYAAGDIPLLAREVPVVDAMYAATMAHPDCSRLFAPGTFTPELVIVWRDEPTGLMCRAMIDAVPDYDAHMLMIDLKTKAGHADPGSVSTSMAKYSYHQQLAFYRSGVLARGLAETVTPVLVVCGKDAPHVPLCRPVEEDAIRMGEVCNRKALDLYATCLASGQWPGYDDPDSPERTPLGLPGWKRYQYRAALEAGLYSTTEGDLF